MDAQRPAHPSPQTDPRQEGAPGQAPASPLAASSSPDAEMLTRSAASAEAFRELALALRTSVEAMQGVRELQGELVRTLKRQDRSELVLQSTQSLNDTFRGLASIQRELLSRLDRSGRRPPGQGRLIPLMLLGLLVVLLGGIFVVLDVLEKTEADRAERGIESPDKGALALDAYRDGKAEGVAEAERTLAQLREQLAQMEEREHALRRQIDEGDGERIELDAKVRALETERENLTAQIRTAQTEVLARRAMEQELRDTTARLAVVEPRLRELEMENQSKRAENARLRQRLADVAIGLPDPDAEAAEAAAVVADPAPLAPPGIEAAGPGGRGAARVDRDPQLLAKIRDRLNQMLDASSRGRGDMWQVTRIGGVTPDRIDGIVVRRYDRRTGRFLEEVDAQQARFWVDRERRAVDLELTEGRRIRGGRAQPLPPGAARQTVAEGEMTRLWSQSGLLFLQFR